MNFFYLKDKIDSALYFMFNALSQVHFLLSLKLRLLVSKNVLYKNIHQGKRCFIFGTGPSLKYLNCDDIEFLKGEFVFAVNSFYKIESLKSIKPKYYLLLDNLYWGPLSNTYDEVSRAYDGHRPTFITSTQAQSLLKNVNCVNRPIYLYQKLYPVSHVSDNISSNMQITLNVISTAILSAMYMGFNEIYLLGCDYTSFCKPVESHAYNDFSEKMYYSESLAFYLKYYHLTTQIHYLIANLAKKNGVVLNNATPGTLLDAYPLTELSTIRSQNVQ